MQLKILGVGTAFSKSSFVSNFLIQSDNCNILIDCGHSCHAALDKIGMSKASINAVIVSHLHGDHVGGLEELAIKNFFASNTIQIISTATLLTDLWNKSLRGGLEYLEASAGDTTPKKLDDYFIVRPVETESWFSFPEVSALSVKLLPTNHILGMESYGFLLRHEKQKIFISGDTKFCPDYVKVFGADADIILHDCSFNKDKTNDDSVHALFEQLLNLPSSLKRKMWLYHHENGQSLPEIANDFAGFAKDGMIFSLD